MRLILFDLDNTLLDGDSNSLWLDFLVAHDQLPVTVLERQAHEYARYQAGTLDIDAYLRFHLGLLATRPVSEWLPWRQRFIAGEAASRISTSARAAVARHRQEGAVLAIVTATQAFLAEGFSSLLDLSLIAPQPAVDRGRFTGNFIGEACFAAGKIDCVTRWLLCEGFSPKSFDETWCYSDSANDLPLLGWVSHPVVVNADARLAAWALERGCPMESWRVAADA